MIITLILISVSLAMDAFSVSVSCGCKRLVKKQYILLAFSFGLFQALMPACGWFLGTLLGKTIATYTSWIAFFLLITIGAKMIWESFHDKPTCNPRGKKMRLGAIIGLSIATSIDAFAIGITLPILELPLLLSCLSIGIITFIISYFGISIGRMIGSRVGSYGEILGGLVLIGLGIKAII